VKLKPEKNSSEFIYSLVFFTIYGYITNEYEVNIQKSLFEKKYFETKNLYVQVTASYCPNLRINEQIPVDL